MENSNASLVAEPIPEMNAAQSSSGPSVSPSSFGTKKILFGILGLLLLLAVVGGGVFLFLQQRSSLPSSSNSGTRQVSLVYWGMMEETDSLKSVFKQFEAEHPGVTVQYSVQSPKDYSERLVSACNRGQCPDIFRFHSTWTKQYVQKGLVAPVPNTVYTASEFESTFYPAVSTDLKSNTGYVGIPLMFDGLGLYVNKRILQASGRSVPTTWDELRTLSRDLTVKGSDGGIERAGIAMGTSNNVDHFSDILATLIYQNGGDPLSPENFGSSNQSSSSPGTAPASLVGDALTFYTQFTRTDKIWNETMPNSTYAFAIERTAMILAPAYRAAEIKKINPNFEFTVYPLPQLPGKPVSNANYWVEGVSKNSKEQQLAWTLLKYLSTKDNLQKINPMGGGKVLKEVYPRVDMAPLLTSDPYAGAIVSQGPYAKSSSLASRTFDKGLNDKLIELYTGVVDKMSGGARYDELAIKFSSQVSEAVRTYSGTPTGSTVQTVTQ